VVLAPQRRSVVWVDGAGAAVDGDPLAVAESGGGVTGGDNSGDAVLAGDQGGMGGQGAPVGDDGSRLGEQRHDDGVWVVTRVGDPVSL
jgi:hypothetical protein